MPTKIEWSEETWNPTVGCTKVSDGCTHCYIERTPPFRMAGRRFDLPGVGGTTGLTLHPERLSLPFKWRKPKRIFVNSMSDLFHESVPDSFIHQVFAVMAATPQHTYQILTKRHGRMRSLLTDLCKCPNAGHQPSIHFRSAMDWVATPHSPLYVPGLTSTYHTAPWPLPNVWLGVSVEDQKWADIRIPALLETPAAVRWLSCEPLLGPVQLPLLNTVDACTCGHYGPHEPTCGLEPGPAWDQLHWVVVGGESGPGARPMDPEWVRSLRRQCERVGIPFFFKQWGEWCHSDQMPADTWMWLDQQINLGQEPHPEPHRVGKKWAGRLLDGRTWDEYPTAVAA